jgi:hypothetical protein
MQELDFSQPAASDLSRAVKEDSLSGLYQTHSSKDLNRAPNQKIKLYSSNKSKQGSSSKSSPAAGQSSQERQSSHPTPEVSTNPFSAALEACREVKGEEGPAD